MIRIHTHTHTHTKFTQPERRIGIKGFCMPTNTERERERETEGLGFCMQSNTQAGKDKTAEREHSERYGLYCGHNINGRSYTSDPYHRLS